MNYTDRGSPTTKDRLPLTWDAQITFLIQNQNFFEWIKEDLRKSILQVENRLKSRPELRPLVANVKMDGESYADLSAAGELLV